MLKQMEYEAKNKEEAYHKCLDELNCQEEDLMIQEELQEGKLFKSSKYKIRVVKKQDISDYICEFINHLSKLMNISISCDILMKEDSYEVTLASDQNGILIGKDGRTLNAIQLFIKRSLQKELNFPVKVYVDASNYKKKKLEYLEKQIKELAREILTSKIDVSLDPMNSYERRMVHAIINEYKNLKTESIGEGKERHIMIKYIEE